MEAGQRPVYYAEYLKLQSLLSAQELKSTEFGKTAHDETLFIIVHQVYELWFKQILHELNYVLNIFKGESVDEKKMADAVSKLDRIIKIQGVLLIHLEIIETMTPMDFLEFRDLLIPASGFQSTQFREIEIKMGLSALNRNSMDKKFFLGRLNDKDKAKLESLEKEENLFSLLEKWLERLPFTDAKKFDFWKAYKKSVDEILLADKQIISSNTFLNEKERTAQLENLDETKKTFYSLLSPEAHKKLISSGKRKLSQKATLNALFILLFREAPILTQPFNFINKLIEIDENFTTWRHRHALMAHRMLGTKIGTGGTSGHEYLKRAADNNRVYNELFDLSTFLIPRSKLPKLPDYLEKELDFNFCLEKKPE